MGAKSMAKKNTSLEHGFLVVAEEKRNFAGG